MREEKIMANNVRLGSRVAIPTSYVTKNGATSRRLETKIVALCSEGMGFVESNPMLDSIAELLKACFGENREIVSAISKVWTEME